MLAFVIAFGIDCYPPIAPSAHADCLRTPASGSFRPFRERRDRAVVADGAERPGGLLADAGGGVAEGADQPVDGASIADGAERPRHLLADAGVAVLERLDRAP